MLSVNCICRVVQELATLLPEEGEKIFVIGNPLKLEGSVSDGIVSAVRELPNIGKIIQITAPISHGNSGSPVFNLKGQVVGVVTIKVTNGQNINLAIGAARVRQLRAGKRRLLAELTTRDKTGDPAESLYKTGLDSLWLGNFDDALGYFENAVNRLLRERTPGCRLAIESENMENGSHQGLIIKHSLAAESMNSNSWATLITIPGNLMEQSLLSRGCPLTPQSAEGTQPRARPISNGNPTGRLNAAKVLKH